ncbi:MAG: hypothetical protein U9Q89_01395 [Thermodesulfobacteriota bacterium]|nr:hypothetical protein [Thermodesulfobacteriota bacterium]
MIKLEKTDIESLEVFLNTHDMRRDLHAFVRYVSENDIKRTHRDNSLPKAHLKRIAKMMSDSSLIRDINEEGYSSWIAFIDRLSLDLGFVDYETTGTYMGYSSHTESYPDNYIEFSDNTYDNFLNQSLQKQEDKILKALVADAAPCNNEFFVMSLLGILDRFDRSGCATGTMNHIAFPKTRTYLLKLLSNCHPGVWYSTASLIEYIESNNPFFLIPEKLPLKRVDHKKDRYHNFSERKTGGAWGESWGVGNLEDRFQRVEGRFVERFLEEIPLSMGYVDVAYSNEKDKVVPSINKLRAFRVTDRLLCAMNKSIKEPGITVLPNYEIHVNSMFYPAKVLNRLLDLCDVITEDVHTVLKLAKKKVIKQLAVNQRLDINGLLRGLSVQDIPANVKKEIADWAEHADDFTVYEGFGLLEGNMDKDSAEQFASVAIAPHVNIVRDPQKLYNYLERAEKIPIYVKHPDSGLKSLADNIQSKFARKNKPKKSVAKGEKFTLKRTIYTILEFPDKGIYEAFTSALLDNGSVLNTNNHTKTVTFTKKDEKIVMKILNSIKKQYATIIKDT